MSDNQKPKQRPVCSECGSDNVGVDAWAEWDMDKQEFAEVRNAFDDAYCFDCDGETSLEWEDVQA